MLNGQVCLRGSATGAHVRSTSCRIVLRSSTKENHFVQGFCVCQFLIENNDDDIDSNLVV